MTLFSRRLPHVLTRSDLGHLLAPTFAREVGVSEELAQERMTRALGNAALANRIYDAISVELEARQENRTEDALMDALSKAVPKRMGSIGPAPTAQSLSAFTVLVNVEIGLAPEDLRATLESERGKTLLDEGIRALGKHLVAQLLR